MFRWHVPIVHSTLINDAIGLKFQDQLDGNPDLSSAQRVTDLISKANKKCLGQPDPVTGDTCLHVAFQVFMNFLIVSQIDLVNIVFQT